jgi:hypothetical protein
MMRTFSSVALVVAVYLLLPAVAFATECIVGPCEITRVPEPGSIALLLVGLGGLAVAKFRKKQ